MSGGGTSCLGTKTIKMFLDKLAVFNPETGYVAVVSLKAKAPEQQVKWVGKEADKSP